MSVTAEFFQPELLSGRRLLAVGPDGDAQTPAIADLCRELGGECLTRSSTDQDWVVGEPLELLAITVAPSVAPELAAGDLVGVELCAVWAVVSGLVGAALAQEGCTKTPVQKLALIAPARDDSLVAGPLERALENMARTLSVEWSRFGVRTVAIAREPETPPMEVAAMVAYLASAAGDYFSGCLLELGRSGRLEQ